ncbi:MAG: hypothetical protein ACRCZU_02550, partial [Selenomonadaceae bacterium]
MSINHTFAIEPETLLPKMPDFAAGIRRAPSRGFHLTKAQTEIALKNALRYIDPSLHEKLIPEFLEELTTRGRIYAYRFRPQERIYGRPIETYPGNCIEGKAFQVMIDKCRYPATASAVGCLSLGTRPRQGAGRRSAKVARFSSRREVFGSMILA